MGSLSGKRGAVTLYPWYVKETIPGDRIILSRNPYYWKVDSEGNQLPYVDEIIFYILEDRDIVAQEAIKGELDTDGMWINGSHLQMLMSNMEEEKFEIGWWRGVPSGAIYFNMAVEDELLQEIFRDPYFRHAASILINREKINWNVYNGFLDITGSSFHRTTPYFTEETARKWVRFDVQRAKEILEEAGYLDTDLDGIYEAPNGRKLSLTVQVSEDNELYTRTLEQMKEDYAKGGIEIIIDRQSHEQVSENLLTNQWDMRIWDGNGFDNPLLYNDYLIDWGSDDYSGANWNRYDSLNPLEGYANFQKLIQNAAHLPYDERVETLKEANNILAEECWILYMGSYVRPYYIGKNIRNHPVEAVRQDVSTPFMLYQTYLVDE